MSGIVAHNGLLLPGLRFSDGDYDAIRITRFVARSPALPTESMTNY